MSGVIFVLWKFSTSRVVVLHMVLFVIMQRREYTLWWRRLRRHTINIMYKSPLGPTFIPALGTNYHDSAARARNGDYSASQWIIQARYDTCYDIFPTVLFSLFILYIFLSKQYNRLAEKSWYKPEGFVWWLIQVKRLPDDDLHDYGDT